MFDALQDKLQTTFGGLRGKGALTEADIDVAMREIRLALLEADVNFKVVKEFVATVKERCLGDEVMKALTPAQQVVKVVNEELVRLMGTGSSKLTFSGRPPTIVLMAGLQGSGKTTTCAKLAKLLKSEDRKPALVACDIYRPAAVDQLVTVGGQVGVPVYQRGTDVDPVEIAKWGVQQATEDGCDVVIVDTAGRLHVDEQLMRELVDIKKVIKPHNILLVLDAMTGQDAVAVAEQFNEAVAFDGVVLTKLDGDARGGAALSVKGVTGKPVKLVSMGEKLDSLEYFHPDRMASRILGMGDMMTLIEKAEQSFDEKEAEELERKMRKSEFTLDDFLKQMRRIKKMGSFGSLLSMLPGIPKELKNVDIDDAHLARIEAIILSMTPEERRDPKVLDGSRRRRVAMGSGSDVAMVNQLVKQFEDMKKMMGALMRGEKPNIPGLPGGFPGPGGGLPPGMGGA
jgi:signal recognition particle subunit SRP54